MGCLAVFQTSGSDARQLVYELGRDRVSEEDIISQPAHNCYVRAIMDDDRVSIFSMAVHRAEPGDPAIADRIRAEASAYLTSAEQLEELMAEAERRDDEYRQRGAETKSGGAPPAGEGEQKDAPADDAKPREPRSKHFQPPTGETGEDAEGEEPEGDG